jgi:hypothetical protein
MFDRLGLVTARLVSANRTDLIDTRINVLRDIRVGVNLTQLDQARQTLSETLQSATTRVFKAIADAYAGLARGRSLSDSDCAGAIDLGLALASTNRRSEPHVGMLTALVGLRLDLAALGSRFRSPSATP